MTKATQTAQPLAVGSTNLLCRAPEAVARRAIEKCLDERAPGYPTYSMTEDGEFGWAFWVVPQDTTSYVGPDLRVQWLGTGWPEDYAYDGDTGRWTPVLQLNAPVARRPRPSLPSTLTRTAYRLRYVARPSRNAMPDTAKGRL